MARLKIERESQHFAQSISGDLTTSEEEELGTQRAQDSNFLMTLKHNFADTQQDTFPILYFCSHFPENHFFT